MLLTPEVITELTFSEDNVLFGIHTYGVVAIYLEGESATVTTSATVGHPIFEIYPTTHNFGNKELQEVSAEQVFTITNTGIDGLTIQNISLYGGDADQFSLDNANELPLTLDANESMTVNVSFMPTSEGSKTTNLTITDNQNRVIHTIPLLGTGIFSPSLSITPQVKDFGAVLIDHISETQDFIIRNAGGGSLRVMFISLAGNDTRHFNMVNTNSLPMTLNSNDSISVSVSFRPTALGARSINMTIADNLGGQAHNINLSGFGQEPLPIQNLDAEVDRYDVTLSWEAPNSAIIPSGYRVLRDGISLTDELIDDHIFVDKDVEKGLYTYSIIALYGEIESSPLTIQVTVSYVTEFDLVREIDQTLLIGNYPNPFNPETVIRFSLKEDTDVLLEVYNIKGHLIRLLVNGNLRAGMYDIKWNGKDEYGQSVGSGVYLYRIRAGEYSSVGRMMLLK
jgi:hypothetical protein